MERIAVAAGAAGIALGALIAAAPAQADPLNPRDPDYCGTSPDVFFCTERRSTYPDAGESAFLDATRGNVPGNDAQHLAAGRAICLELPSRPAGSVVNDVGNYLHIGGPAAGQVVQVAVNTICPKAEPQP